MSNTTTQETSGNGSGTTAAQQARTFGKAGQVQRWNEIQASFVDNPRQAVADADFLVADVLDNVVKSFAARRSALEAQWEKGETVSTEELRCALQSYRAFFHRLLSAGDVS